MGYITFEQYIESIIEAEGVNSQAFRDVIKAHGKHKVDLALEKLGVSHELAEKWVETTVVKTITSRELCGDAADKYLGFLKKKTAMPDEKIAELKRSGRTEWRYVEQGTKVSMVIELGVMK